MQGLKAKLSVKSLLAGLRKRKIIDPDKDKGDWTQLASYPFRECSSRLLNLNDDEFLAVCGKQEWTNQDVDGIYKYNVKTDTWNCVMDFNDGFGMWPVCDIAIDETKQLVFVGERHGI